MFDEHLSLVGQISNLTKSCFFHIRDLRRVRSSLDLRTARIIATSLVHSKLDYCNSLYLNLPSSQINRLQLIQNATARAVAKCSKFDHITPTLKSLHWLRIRERIHYKLLSITYNTLQFHQPSHLDNLIKIQPSGSTRSSDFVTLKRLSNPSRLKTVDRFFQFYAPILWNSLPAEFRQPSTPTSNLSTISLSPKLFHSKLKTYLFRKSYPPD